METVSLEANGRCCSRHSFEILLRTAKENRLTQKLLKRQEKKNENKSVDLFLTTLNMMKYRSSSTGSSSSTVVDHSWCVDVVLV